MNVSNNTMQKLRALYVVAYDERCTDGERVNAKTLLKRLLKKYDISESEIRDSELHWLSFKADGEYELILLGQLCVYLRQSGNKQFSYKKYNGKVYLEVTEAEYVELKRLFPIHSKKLGEELDFAVQAYITRNSLFGGGKGKPIEEMTKKELDELENVLLRARLMKKTDVHEKRVARLLK